MLILSTYFLLLALPKITNIPILTIVFNLIDYFLILKHFCLLVLMISHLQFPFFFSLATPRSLLLELPFLPFLRIIPYLLYSCPKWTNIQYLHGLNTICLQTLNLFPQPRPMLWVLFWTSNSILHISAWISHLDIKLNCLISVNSINTYSVHMLETLESSSTLFLFPSKPNQSPLSTSLFSSFVTNHHHFLFECLYLLN